MKTFIIILIASALTFIAFIVGFALAEKLIQFIKKSINSLNK
jgi:hypothetical protein